MEAAQRDYWWGFEEKRGTYVTSWKNLKLHKDCGGQGFRDLKILNQALLVRAAWRICTHTDTRWGKALQAKYFSSTSFLHASIKNNCSWAWKGFQKQTGFIKQHSRWRLGNGEKIKIWLDTWVTGLDAPPVPREGIMDSESYIWVQQLILQDSNSWNSDLVNYLFEGHTASLVLRMRIPLYAEDKLIWKLTHNGGFTLKPTYKKLYENSLEHQSISLSVQNTGVQWKEFWKIYTWPRIKHFFWKCFSDILPTKERLSRSGHHTDKKCPLCNQQDETIMHVLFSCSFSKAVWALIPGGSTVIFGTFNNVAEIFETWMQNGLQQFLPCGWMHLAMVVTWTIWNTRCDVQFQNLKTTPQVVATKAINFASYLEKLYSKQQYPSLPNTPTVEPNNAWKPPLYPFLKINCDASYDSATGLTGIALVLRDVAGNWRGGLSKCYTGVGSSEQAECLAFLDAVTWGVELKLTEVIVETDLKGIENYINNTAPVISWESEAILLDAISLFKYFNRWSCSFVPRVCNKTADKLAKYCRHHNISKVWLYKPPAIIESSLLSEKPSHSD